MRALARQLQIENRDRRGVHICIVSPGGVDTPIYLQAANYLGQVGRPPFPVVSPERVARAALALAEKSRPRPRVQVGPANSLIALGFTLFPGIYDALVTPLFTMAATNLRHRVGPGTGNVLSPVAPLNRLHGEQGNPIVGIVGNLLAQLRSAVGRRPA